MNKISEPFKDLTSLNGIEYISGDATDPIDTLGQDRLICHISNNRGGWGRGFVSALSREWSKPESDYRSYGNYCLGDIIISEVGPGLSVISMIAQNGYRSPSNPVAVDYDALRTCLEKVSAIALSGGFERLSSSVHMPRIGCGLGGGDWDVISDIIDDELIFYDVPVFVYDLTN